MFRLALSTFDVGDQTMLFASKYMDELSKGLLLLMHRKKTAATQGSSGNKAYMTPPCFTLKCILS